MTSVRTGTATGLTAQVLLLAAMAGTVGLGPAGWAAGVACGLVTNLALARGLTRAGLARRLPADRVTAARATLVGGIAALVADSFWRPVPVPLLVALAAVALVLDGVDGWVARRTGTASRHGALFDQEVDAFLLLVLSAYVATTTAGWVLVIGVARYAFAVTGWALRWLREPLPPRYWGKVVAVVQGVTLTVAAAGVLPRTWTYAALAAALLLLAESFGRSIWWLWARRAATRPLRRRVPAGARGVAAALTTTAAVLVVWVALVVPNPPARVAPAALARLPVEGLAVVALALALPRRAGRAVAVLAGAALGLLALLRILDAGFVATLDRRFDPVSDWRYATTATETLAHAIGGTGAAVAVTAAALLALAVLLLAALSMRRLVRLAEIHRPRALRAVAVLGLAWVALAVPGAQVVRGAPIASASAAALAFDEVRAVRSAGADRAVLERAVARDRFRDAAGDRLLTGLRGKDVLVVFVESYGRVAVEGAPYAAEVGSVLDAGTRRLQARGFATRSAWLTSPTFGGTSWLAHATLQSGVWTDSQRRYDRLMQTDRFTLSQAFRRAGWRTVVGAPSNSRAWPQARSFYHFDQVYDRRNVGYRGPVFAYASMPDEYVLAALQRLELARHDRPPVFAEIDLVSSHTPWTRLPPRVGWDRIGDGSVFHQLPVEVTTKAALWKDADRVRRAYARSIGYSLDVLIAFVEEYGDEDLVLVVLGDHQPAPIVSGSGASRDVPVTVIAHDVAVTQQIATWGWDDGMRPGRDAPVWRMDSFRDRFLTAYGPQPADPGA